MKGGVPLIRVAPWLQPGVTVFAGAPGDRLREFPVLTVDLLAEDRTVTENARLTAEAALLLVMEHTGRSLWRRRCAVIGFGRIGKLLALQLQAWGAQVSVLARKAGDRALAGSLGMEALSPTDGPGEGTELIFNTVPAQALATEVLLSLPADCLWVELASAPGGLPEGLPLPFSVLPGGGLPGRLLPDSAARVLYDAILRLGN